MPSAAVEDARIQKYLASLDTAIVQRKAKRASPYILQVVTVCASPPYAYICTVE